MHVGLLCTHVFKPAAGGTVKLCLDIATALTRRGHRVSVYTDLHDSAGSSRNLPPGIKTRAFSFNGEHRVIDSIRKCMLTDELDVVVSIQSYREHLLWATALLGSGIPFIYSEHNAPFWIETKWSRAGRLAAMSGADFIHLLLPEYANSLPGFLQERVVHISNPAPPLSPDASPLRSEASPLVLCSLGRIAPVKELPLLMRAFAKISGQFPQWELHLWGQDNVEMSLAEHWLRNPARDRIRLRGLAPDPLAVFRQAHIFCIPSQYEGLPLTVLEAMSCGLPVVGFTDCIGVRALVRDGENGLLVSARREDELAKTLGRLMQYTVLRERLGAGGVKTAAAIAPEAIWDQWEALLCRAAALKKNVRMSHFVQEPFASRARLSSAARQEWVLHKFGDPLRGTLAWYARNIRNWWHAMRRRLPPFRRNKYEFTD